MKRYSAKELAFVKSRKLMPRDELARAFASKFRRHDVTPAKLQDLCNRKGWGVGSLVGRRKGRSSLYSVVELAFIKRRRKMERSKLHAAFVEKFGRGDISCDNIRQLCKRNGWLTDPVDRRKRQLGRTSFSKAELAFIRRRRETPRRQLHAEFVEKFDREMTLAAFKTFCKKWGAFTGRTGQFEKGHVPWTQGKKLTPNANSARTQFKKGQRPHNTKPDGYERIDGQRGVVLLRVNETNPYTGGATRYLQKHYVLWREMHGPLPKGMALKCKGNPANPDPSNWEAVPRGVLPRLNGQKGRRYDQAPAELKPTMMAVAKLEQAVFERRRRS